MRVFIDDGMRISLGTGIGKYTQNLYESLCRLNNIDVELSDFKPTAQNRILNRIQYLIHINSIPFYRKMGQYDVVHFCGQFFPLLKNKKAKYVATVHDLVAFKNPESLKPLNRVISKLKIERIVKNADVVLTVSESVKKELVETFPGYEQKFYAIYPGNYNDVTFIEDGTFNSATLCALNNSPFFLFVGTIEKRKNIGMILDAYVKLRKQYPASSEYKLVLSGRAGFGYDEFKQIAEKSGYSSDIIFTGYISDYERNLLYSKAAAYIFPTVYEGFGSTQLECMKCHTPLILSDIPTNREVSREYGMYFSLNDTQTLIDSMEIIVSKKYDRTYHNSLADQYLVEFCWDKLVTDYVAAYNRALNFF